MKSKTLLNLIAKQAQKIIMLEQKLAAAEEARDYWYKQQLEAAGSRPAVVLFGGEQ